MEQDFSTFDTDVDYGLPGSPCAETQDKYISLDVRNSLRSFWHAATQLSEGLQDQSMLLVEQLDYLERQERLLEEHLQDIEQQSTRLEHRLISLEQQSDAIMGFLDNLDWVD